VYEDSKESQDAGCQRLAPVILATQEDQSLKLGPGK
jgi:hypothetical protein